MSFCDSWVAPMQLALTTTCLALLLLDYFRHRAAPAAPTQHSSCGYASEHESECAGDDDDDVIKGASEQCSCCDREDAGEDADDTASSDEESDRCSCCGCDYARATKDASDTASDTKDASDTAGEDSSESFIVT